METMFNYYSLDECIDRDVVLEKLIKLKSDGKIIYSVDMDILKMEDIDLEEFSDEIDSWIIDELKGIGCDTAKSVLALPVEDLVRRTELEEETVLEVRRILEAEFE
jgi:hypothetical protein